MEDHAEADLAAVASVEARVAVDLAEAASEEDAEADFTVAFTAASDIAHADIFTVAADCLTR